MRTQIKAYSWREVELTTYDYYGPLTRRFYCSEHGGYITEEFGGEINLVGPELAMVPEMHSSSGGWVYGPTPRADVLYCLPGQPLVDIIRDQYRVMKSRHGR